MAYQYSPGGSRWKPTGGTLVDGRLRHDKFTQASDAVQQLEELHTSLGSVSQDSLNIPAYYTLGSSSQAVSNCSTDLAGWIDCMIEELSSNTACPIMAPQQQHGLLEGSFLKNDHDASSCRDSLLETGSHRLSNVQFQDTSAARNKSSTAPHNGTSQVNAIRTTAAGLEQQHNKMGEDENNGIQLVHSLLACAESIQRGNLSFAEETLRRIELLSLPPGPMGKVATHFIGALTRRIYGVASSSGNNSSSNQSDSLLGLLHFYFYESCPFLRFAHFTANQAILEAVTGLKEVHVIDFNLMQGLQWPALIQALSLRQGGPPRLRLTGIGPPQPSGSDTLQEIGTKLAELAKTVRVDFEFRGVIAVKLDDIKPWMLQIRHGEAVAVNSVLQLHKLLYSAGPEAPIDAVLLLVRELKPKIFTIVEHEANHNQPSFLGRFIEALHYYSTMFDALEACNLPSENNEQVLIEMYLGREIYNIVACEDGARTERHENLFQWRLRLLKAGYRPIQLGLNAFKQASMLLTMFSGEGYRVEEKLGCLTLGWHSRPLIAASAWKCA